MDLLNRNDKPNSLIESKIAALTHDQRDKWHENRLKFFLDNKINKKALKIIEKAFVFLVLDENCDYNCLEVSFFQLIL